MDDLLEQGITACKAGRRDEARSIFIAVVKQNPNSERAWGWMYQVSNNDQERIHCMKQALRINPANEKAKQILDSLMFRDSPFEVSQNIAPPKKKEINTSSSETIYYQDGNITVTNSRAVLGTKTYAMANITSVSMGFMPAKRMAGMVMIVLGLLLILGSCGTIGRNDLDPTAFSTLLICGLIPFSIGVLINVALKNQYVVKIGSASGESNALSSIDSNHIQKIVNAINEAIINRG